MTSFKQYDVAISEYHMGLSVKRLPVFSWDFNHEFIVELKKSFLDLNKLKSIALKNKWTHNNLDLKSRLTEEVILVTDATLRIVFASHNMLKMNGYAEAEVLGRSPKMFQGLATDSTTSNEIRDAIQLKQPFEKRVMNYKKNGDLYACLIKGFPIFNLKGELSHYIAFEKVA